MPDMTLALADEADLVFIGFLGFLNPTQLMLSTGWQNWAFRYVIP
jgi:hypothetical protein